MKRLLMFLVVCLPLFISGNAQTRKPVMKTNHTTATRTRTTRAKTVRSTKKTSTPPSANGKFHFTYKEGFTNISDGKNYVIITAGGKSASDIKSSVLSSLSDMYTNPNKVISTIGDNIINVNGYARNAFVGQFAGNNVYFSFNYNIKIEIKDSKIKVDAPTFSNITKREVYEGETLGIDYIDTDDLYFQLSLVKNKLIEEQVADIFNSHITKIVEGLTNSNW